MEKYIWSPSLNGFFPTEEKPNFKELAKWPTDGIEVSASSHAALFPIPEGKCIGTVDGYPGWIDLSPPTYAEVVIQIKAEKQRRIDTVNAYMNGKQWPGKAALGRIKNDELKQYNLWLDYLDALEAVDITLAPDIAWPDQPE